MNIYYLIYVTVNFLVTYTSVGTKPLQSNQRSFSENRLQCMESEDPEAAERNNKVAAVQNAGEYFQPNRPKYEVSDSTKLLQNGGPQFDFKQKRTVLAETLQKRQVGVIYREEKPIGILQPYQRSYRFIPVKEENAYALETNPVNQQISPIQEVFSGQSVTVDKRNVKDIDAETEHFMKETYPQILANFKLETKLEKKRSEAIKQPINDASIRDLKATIRKLRSAPDAQHAERIEEQLKGILDDMGLIEEDEAKGISSNNEKREVAAAAAAAPAPAPEPVNVVDSSASNSKEEKRDAAAEINISDDDDGEDPMVKTQHVVKDRTKRGEFCKAQHSPITQNKSNNLMSMEVFPNTLLGLEDQKKADIVNKRQSSETEPAAVDEQAARKKRDREQKSTRSNMMKADAELLENLKDSGDLMVSGNKSPLASSSEVRVRESGAAVDDKLDDQDYDAYENRVERQIQDKIQSLKEEVKREIEALKEEEDKRKKRQTGSSNLVQEEKDEVNPVNHPESEMLAPLIRRRRHLSLDEEDGGDLLGDDYDDKAETKRDHRRSILDDDEDEAEDRYGNNEEERNKRGQAGLTHANFYDSNNDLYEDETGVARMARQTFEDDEENDEQEPVKYQPLAKKLQRSRRRISEEQSMDARPQQLSDMSDIDLFGALPKSYDGQLSRYKRVKRIKME